MNSHQTQYDKMTKTPVSKLILKLAFPSICTMLVSNIYNLADTAFVGSLGNSASGAVGIVFGFMALLQAIGFLFGQGCGSMLSRKLGQQDEREAGIIASVGFFTAFFLALVAEAICFLCLDDLVFWLGSTATIAPYAKTYIFYVLLASPFVVTSFTMNNILRYEGKSMLGMIGMMTGAVLNIAGDAVLMFGFHLGIAGAGISTAVSQLVSFLILLSMFLTGRTQSKLSLRMALTQGKSVVQAAYFRYLYDVTSTGFPSLLRQGLNSVATVILNKQAGAYGDEAVAAMSIVSRIVFFVFSIAIGIGQGFQPVSAFNYGAKKYGRVQKAYWFSFWFAEGLMVILCTLLMIFSGGLIQQFRDDALVIEIGTRALRLHGIGVLFLPFCMVTEMMMQSTGHKLGATILSASRSGFIFIPCLLILSALRGLAGIQEAQLVAFVLSVIPAAVLAVYFFRHMPKEDQEIS